MVVSLSLAGMALYMGYVFLTVGIVSARIDGNCEKMCSTPDDVLEYMVGNDCLRDVITKVTVISRTI